MMLFVWTLIACNGKNEGEELGEYTTDTGGLTEDIPFAVPDGSTSAVVYCGPYGDDLVGTAWEIKNPDGDYVYTNEFHDDYAPTKMRVGNLDDLLPVLMPVSPDLDLESGDHTMKVWIASDGEPVTIECDAIYRTASVPNTGTIDVHFWFVGTDVDESTAETDEDFATVLAHLRKWWERRRARSRRRRVRRLHGQRRSVHGRRRRTASSTTCSGRRTRTERC